MDFRVLTTQRFEAGVDRLPRIMWVEEKKNGRIGIVSTVTGDTIFELHKQQITVDGQPYTYEGLQKVVFNDDCVCAGIEDDSEYRIFDLSFDNTFE